MVFVHVRGVLYGILQKRKEKRNEKKKVNVPVTGRHALLSPVVFVPLLYTVYVLFMTMLSGCTLI